MHILYTIHCKRKKTLPSYSFMLQKFSRIIAFGGGSGLSTFAAGTSGSFVAWLLFKIFNLQSLSIISFTILAFFTLLIGTWASSQTQKSLDAIDSSYIVVDEWLGVWISLWFLYYYLGSATLFDEFKVFILFRVFDILKPMPIKNIEQRMKSQGLYGGFGVMLDDILAAFYVILLIYFLF